MSRLLILCLYALSYFTLASAQFQFFEQMFQQGGQQQQQQEKQNVASDSEWYQQTYDSGMSVLCIAILLL